MRRAQHKLHFSATDLANFLGCKHATELDRAVVEGRLDKDHRKDPMLDLLIELGERHERRYIEHLRASGKSVVEFEKFSDPDGTRTADAMRSGVDVIVQGRLDEDPWGGYPDFLLRVERFSQLGSWSYEVADTKLSMTTKATAVLQLCLYTELLTRIQGLQPELMHVIKPNAKNHSEPFDIERLRVDDYMAYYRMAKRSFEAKLAAPADEASKPEPCNHCQICNWWSKCDEEWRGADHLSLIAGIAKSQRIELVEQGITSLTQFAEAAQPLERHPKRGSLDAYHKVHRQAQIQLKGRQNGKPEYEFNEIEKDRGFLLLPEPNEGDVFFDIEGTAGVGGAGIEYLFGYVVLESGAPKYQHTWSLYGDEERRMFEQFVDFLTEHWQRHPHFHIYHYAPYEPSALKRLMTKYATREDDVDRLLRGRKFVDLYAVTRQAIRASVESYSIKQLESFYGYERKEMLDEASKALRDLERLIALQATADVTEDQQRIVALYNEDDCLSTLHLRNWLEELRTNLVDCGLPIPRPEREQDEDGADSSTSESPAQQLFAQLTMGIEDNRSNSLESARWLLAHLLEYFRREDKCVWWEFFRMHELEHEELLTERTAISGLVFETQVPGPPKAKNPTHRYRFPTQEVAMVPGNELHEVMGTQVGSVVEVVLTQCYVDIRKRGDAVDVHPSSVFVHERFQPEPMPHSLLVFAEQLLERLNSDKVDACARLDLLSQAAPRLKTLSLPLGPNISQPAIQLAIDLDSSVLAIQGPPGTGKTHVGSELIAELAARGKRVGVTAVSHKVITNLLARTHTKGDGRIAIAQRTSRDDLPVGCRKIAKSPDVLNAVIQGEVVGGTAWVWSRDDLEQQLDYLIVDEAGQMSLAMVLAAARAARNVILLGDPQQLEQPQQGSHPQGAEVAALKHMLAGDSTVAANRGLFLNYTWRMHPTISKFISQQFYDGRLVSRYGLERQAVLGNSSFVGSGLFFCPVQHEGCQSNCAAEVDAVRRICENLTADHKWRDAEGTIRELRPSDILVVAPYNAQVAELRKILPASIRVGTVDRFQGQEAPVVIYSLTSSSIEDAPRGMEFLFSPNRLNVAVSRARSVSILVGCPTLFTPDCSTPEQMVWANAFALFGEHATHVQL